MAHTTTDMLDAAGTEVEYADRTDTPIFIIKGFPIEKAILPISATGIPPLSCGVSIIFSVFIEYRRVSTLARIIIYISGS